MLRNYGHACFLFVPITCMPQKKMGIFCSYSRSYPAQPRTSVVSKPEQNLVLLVRDPGTPHVQSVPELTGHFSTGRCPLSLTPFSAGPDPLYCRFRSFLQIGRVSQDVFQNCKTGNFIWPKRVCSFGDDIIITVCIKSRTNQCKINTVPHMK